MSRNTIRILFPPGLADMVRHALESGTSEQATQGGGTVSARSPEIDFAPAAVAFRRRQDGTFYLSSPQQLAAFPRSIGFSLRHWGSAAPDRPFLAERAGDDEWHPLTYGQALAQAEKIAAALLDRALGPDRPLVILSANSISFALLQLAALYVGVPVVPISTAYSLMSSNFSKLEQIIALVTPGMIFAEDGQAFAAALRACRPPDCEIVTRGGRYGTTPCTAFEDLTAYDAGRAVNKAFEAVGPDTIAKILFTSGSTGTPKGVINTHGMLCANQQALVQIWPFLKTRPPVIVDWLPWNHTFGGNFNFNMVLTNGGTLYIDQGKPAPHLFETTIRNLKSVSPTLYFNVPVGYQALVSHLEEDEDLRESFFRRLDVIFCAAAALPRGIWQRLKDMSQQHQGGRVLFSAAWGATETAPLVTNLHFDSDQVSNIGLPVPGCTLKFALSSGKHEMRVKGPNIMPGYWRDRDQSTRAFDEEGFYRTGDAGRLIDAQDPAKGILFDGRTAENFKLITGTWVLVGDLRLAAIEAAPDIVQDAVITGHDREEVGLLVFPNWSGCKALIGAESAALPEAEIIAHQAVQEALIRGLAEHNRKNAATSRRFGRALLLCEPPDADKGEINDKGYINQRAVLENRAMCVDRLYGAGPGVLLIPKA